MTFVKWLTFNKEVKAHDRSEKQRWDEQTQSQLEMSLILKEAVEQDEYELCLEGRNHKDVITCEGRNSRVDKLWRTREGKNSRTNDFWYVGGVTRSVAR
jgi:hypothetical protein